MATNLAPNELLRPDKMWTRSLFLTKFKNGEPFTLHKGQRKVTLESDRASIAALEKAFKGRGDATALNDFEFVDTNGNRYTGTGRFQKTNEFGSTGGLGGGSRTTKTTESAQCIYNVALILKNGVGYKFTIEHLEEAFKSNKTQISERSWKKIKDINGNWKESSELIAQELRLKLPLYFKTNMEHHHQSSFVAAIEARFKLINGIISPKQFGNINKWNPADIWIVKSGYKSTFLQELKKTETFIQINRLLEQGIIDKKLIGVSLKMAVRTATLEYVNHKQGGWTPPSYEYESHNLSPRHFMKSNNGTIIYDSGQIVFRTVRGPSAFNGEILGKRARHGKISGQHGTQSALGIYGDKYLNATFEREAIVLSKHLNTPEKSLEKFWRYYLLTGDKSFDNSNSGKNDFIDKVSEKDVQWYVSKYKATELMAALAPASKEDKDKFVTACICYASSQSENSAPFVKVS